MAHTNSHERGVMVHAPGLQMPLVPPFGKADSTPRIPPSARPPRRGQVCEPVSWEKAMGDFQGNTNCRQVRQLIGRRFCLTHNCRFCIFSRVILLTESPCILELAGRSGFCPVPEENSGGCVCQAIPPHAGLIAYRLR